MEDEKQGASPEIWVVPIIFAIIFIIGVLGNGTLIAIFLRHRELRNVPNTFIFTLAIGDLCVCLVCIPFVSTIYTFHSWPYGEMMCKLAEYVNYVSIGVSVFTLTALSMERYAAIRNPLSLTSLRGNGSGGRGCKIRLLSCLLIWSLALLTALPSLIYTQVVEFEGAASNETIRVCYPYPKELGLSYSQAMATYKFLLYYALPLGLVSFFYAGMARGLLESTRGIPGEGGGRSQSQMRARKKVAKIVLAFVIIFAICFLPSHVYFLWWYYTYPRSMDNYNIFWHYFKILGFVLGFCNSCINPIAMYVMSDTFRKHFNRYLFCSCRGTSRDLSGLQSQSQDTQVTYRYSVKFRSGTHPSVQL
ncbi:unnamed protein product [Darwinula stevensoni]|uniref:G-protein coupled receptors family 1 profile domain-containing protein n=1 Tax=Darwinula stevensoni TaxID=69355 RepID=A0A7R8XBA2_9CRUS|nr:unnamed protein product [Darwinula stevensoni]CAG0890848.1 unnamed protein product [Darwinula stevensoni]